MFRVLKQVIVKNGHRTYKNFGHKRQPIPTVTTLWHGFLTLTFIGLALDWKRIGTFIFGTSSVIEEPPLEHNISQSSGN